MSRLPRPDRATRDAAIQRLWDTATTRQIGAQVGMDPSDVRKSARRLGLPGKSRGPTPTAFHGTRYRYTRGCHCDLCRAAQRRYMQDRRSTPGTGQHKKPRALATLLNRNGRENATGHGSLARAKAGCDCPRCTKALAEKHQPNGPPMWRCGCDPYRLNAGDITTCPACGTVPGWATNREPERRTG